MKAKKGSFFYIFLILLNVNSYIFGQSVFSGTLLNYKGEKINGASIILRSIDDKFIAFQISNDDGSFKYQYSNTIDSVILNINHLTYEPKTITIAEFQNINIVLEERVNNLPELVVKSPPVYRIGDTITYDVTANRKISDRNLEDLLKRLPGVEILSNGKILYDGLDISHFFIENLDMFQGSYSIATRNLNLNNIDKIEILERYQHIKVLDSLYKPLNAAINIKLKNKIDIIGTSAVGLGYNPGLQYNFNSNVFGFSKKYQISILGSLNNTGENRKNELINHNDVQEYDIPFLSTTSPILPVNLVERNFNFNKDAGFGTTYLKSFKNKLTLNNKIFIYNQFKSIESNNRNDFGDGNKVFTFFQELNNTKNQFSIESFINLEYNSNKLYVKSENFITLVHEEDLSNNKINSLAINEVLNKKVKRYSSKNKFIFKSKSNAIAVFLDVKAQNNDFDLSLNPSNFLLENGSFLSFNKNVQRVKDSHFKVHLYSTDYRKFKKYNILSISDFGLKYHQGILSSNLFDVKDTNSLPIKLIDEFENHLKPHNFKYYANNRLERKIRNVNLIFSNELAHNSINVLDKKIFIHLNAFSFISKLEMNKFFSNNNINSYIKYSRSVDLPLFINNNYILNSYQNLTRNRISLVPEIKKEIYFGYRSTQIGNMLSYRFSLNFSQSISNQQSRLLISDKGILNSIGDQKLISNVLSGDFRFSRPINNNLSVLISNNYRFVSSDLNINAKVSNILFLTSQTNISTVLTLKKFSLSYIPALAFTKNSFFKRQIQFFHNADLFYKFSESSTLKFDYFHDIYFFVDGIKVNKIASLSFDLKPKKFPFTFNFRFSNIFNNNSFYYFSQVGYTSNELELKIRPVSLLLSAKRDF